MHRWLLLLLLLIGTAHGQSRVDVCQMMWTKTPVHGALIRFDSMGSLIHGRMATSRFCPRLSTDIDFSALGKSKEALAFRRWLDWTPKQQSGIAEIVATADFSGSELVIRRVHSYRELSEEEAKVFRPHFSPAEEAELRAIVDKVAKDADEAGRP